MDDINFGRFILAFIFVIGLIGVMGFVLKRFGQNRKWLGMNEAAGRLTVVETRYLDAKRRLVLIRRDDREHLLLFGEGRELVVESGIESPMIEPDVDVVG